MTKIFVFKNLNEIIWLTFFLTAFILGNAALNFFILFSALYLLLNYKKINFNESIGIYLVLIYLLYIFFLGFFYDDLNIKNFSQIRFFILVYFFYFIRKNNPQFDTILLSISKIFIIFISLDIIYQSLFLIDLFGFKLNHNVPTGPFENEVAGSFLSKIFFFTSAYFFLKNGALNINRIFIIIITFIAITLTTERMAFFQASAVLFVLIFFEFYVNFNNKKKIISLAISILLVFNLLIFSEKIRVNFIGKTINQLGFFELSYKIIQNTKLVNNYVPTTKYKKEYLNEKYLAASTYSYLQWGFETKENENPHKKLFNSAFQIFKENPYIGTGIKTFFNECNKKLSLNQNHILFQCSTHPHNIHIQILSEAGIVAYILFILMVAKIIYDSLRNFLTYKKIYHLGYLLGLIILILPLPSGNMFGTWPGSFFWFIISLNIYNKNNLIKKS